MAFPVVIIGSIIKGIVGLVKQFGVPLAAFLQGKKDQELKQLKKEAENAKESDKIKDGASRVDDDILDDILHD